MPAGTSTKADMSVLAASPAFKNRVQSSLLQQCANVSSEIPTGTTGTMPNVVHARRKALVSQILLPSSFASYVTQFTFLASVNQAVIDAATQAATNYVALSGSNVDTVQAANVTDTLVDNAVSAVINDFISDV